MTVIVERAVVAVVKIEAPSIEDANKCFDDLVSRVYWSLPKRRLGAAKIIERTMTLRNVSIRGVIGKAPK